MLLSILNKSLENNLDAFFSDFFEVKYKYYLQMQSFFNP